MRRIIILAMTLFGMVLVCLVSHSRAPAKDAEPNQATTAKGYAGAEICQTCHQELYDKLAKTSMGVLILKHPRSAREQLGCETCHGPAAKHVESGGQSFEGMTRFTKGTKNPVCDLNAVCMKCHQKKERLFWSGSVHDNKDLACTTCHTVHGPGAANANQLTRLTVDDTCGTCHKEQVRAELRFSHHPLREGKMDCTSCHNPHGTVSPHLVRGISNRELCFNCHAQYRGPFIFQHPPVMEDCFNCHQPHGSPYPSLLKAPPIRLCRECHVTFHTLPFQGGTVGPVRPNMMVGGACLNCHRNIHGSNSMNGSLFFR
jgi:DmsE family decaheme c-type cytochrome